MDSDQTSDATRKKAQRCLYNVKLLIVLVEISRENEEVVKAAQNMKTIVCTAQYILDLNTLNFTSGGPESNCLSSRSSQKTNEGRNRAHDATSSVGTHGNVPPTTFPSIRATNNNIKNAIQKSSLIRLYLRGENFDTLCERRRL